MAEADLIHPKRPSSSDLEKLATEIREAAQQRQGDNLALLSLLRMLEQIHRDITDGLFQEALPTNRQALYSFLRDIENHGGWPYIYSRKLRVVLSNLVTTLNQVESITPPAASDSPETENPPEAG